MKDDQTNLPSERQVWVASIISALARAVEDGHAWSVYPSEARALVAEVERLRVEAATMRSWAEEAARAENENAEDARRERAAVVAYLRRRPVTWRGASSPPFIMDAAGIERGEHRREEK